MEWVKRHFDRDSIASRLLLVLVVVLATWNPSGVSYFHWLTAEPLTFTPGKAAVGALLLVGWVVLVRATRRSFSATGIVLAGIGLGFVGLTLMYWGVLPRNSFTVLQWLGELVLVGILMLGLCWPRIQRRLARSSLSPGRGRSINHE